MHATAELKHAQRFSAPLPSVAALQSPALLLQTAEKQGCSFPSPSDLSCCELSSSGMQFHEENLCHVVCDKLRVLLTQVLFAPSQQAASLPGLPS